MPERGLKGAGQPPQALDLQPLAYRFTAHLSCSELSALNCAPTFLKPGKAEQHCEVLGDGRGIGSPKP